MIRIFNVVVSTRVLTLFLSETALLYGCFIVAAHLTALFDQEALDFVALPDQFFWRIAFVVCQFLLCLYFFDLYSNVQVRNRIVLALDLCMIFIIAVFGQGITAYIAPDKTVPPKVMLAGSALSVISLWGLRLLFDVAARGVVRSSPVLFIGMSPTVEQLAGYLRLHPEIALAPAGYVGNVEPGGDPTGTEPVRRLGSAAELDSAIEDCNPTLVVIAKPTEIKPWWTEEFLELRFGGIYAEDAGTIYEKALGRIALAEILPSKLVFSSSYDPQPMEVNLQSIYSRTVALAAGVIALPLACAIAALLKGTSTGPILAREKRVGLNGGTFMMYRFRTEHSTAASTAAVRVGRFLRATGLHSLPALINVITGDMALVGPRPERPEYDAKLSQALPFYRQRSRVKPGITGWEQIHQADGKRDPDALRCLEFDLYYVKHLSLSLDWAILMLALKKAFVGRALEA